ncbi:MAG: 16S rRNA (adenine(1518)-N(6)/adenine(1519)-N(6))-dimethyltransferase RsmA [Gammaproteobacteria bacterium]
MTDAWPRKRFGQNFLHEKKIIQKIILGIAPHPGDHFVEIGPGKGALTASLARTAARLDVIEIDRDLVARLRQQKWADAIHIHEADALQFDFAMLDSNSMRLVGNLPYNISTPLLFHILRQAELFTDIHVMLQKEVVDRMAAGPGSKTYGRLSVALAARCIVEPLFNIKPGAFTPAPKVDSSFARLVPLAVPLIDADTTPAFEAVVTSAFGMRRKKLGNSLAKLLNKKDIIAADVDPSQRAEELSVQAFVRLAEQYLQHAGQL